MTKQENQEGYPQGLLREYVPSWDADQIVYIRTPTESARRKINSAIAKNIKLEVGELKGMEGKTRAELEDQLADKIVIDMHANFDWQELAVRLCVESFKSPYAYKGAKATDGLQFSQFADTNHLTEVADEIWSEHSLTIEEKKSSKRSSALGPVKKRTKRKKRSRSPSASAA